MKKINNQTLKKIYIPFLPAILFVLWLTHSANSASLLEIDENDYFIGNKDAPITIIEYASIESVLKRALQAKIFEPKE